MMNSGNILDSFLNLVFQATPEGRLVNALILLVFAVGLLRVLYHLGALRGLSVELSSAKDALRTSGARRFASAAELFLSLGWSATTPDTGAEGGPESQAEPIPKTDLQRCVLATYRLGAAGRSGVQVLTELGSLKRDLDLQLPRYLVSILVLLGLGGTVWGLQGIVNQAGVALSARATSVESPERVPRGGSANPQAALSDQDTSVESLVKALRPMGMAFSCTFCGILTSVVLAWALSWAERRQDALDAELGEFLVADILPLVGRGRSTSAYLEDMRDVLRKSTEFIDRFADTVAETRSVFAETIRQAVHEAASEMLASVSQMRDVAKEMSTAAASLEGYRRALEADREADREDFQRLLRETRDATMGLVRVVAEPMASLADRMEATADELRSLRTDLVSDREAWASSYRSIIQEDRESHELIVRQTKDAAVELVRSAVDPIESTAEIVRMLYDRLATDRGAWEAWFQERLNSVASTCESLSAAGQQVRQASAEHGEMIQALLGRVAGSVSEYAEAQRQVAELLGDLVSRISPASIKTRDGKRLAELLEQFDQSTLGLQRELQQLMAKSDATLTDMRTVVNGAVTKLTEISGDQIESLSEVVRLLRQLRAAFEAPIWTRILGYRR